ncbi:MAG: hypothetical protein IPG50_04660 [Myxococcales bacterium]|nr:hypothetical protein [Myxococcales bacterium]
MSERVNLSDPDFEPTDEQLVGLSTRAFAHVKASRDAARVRTRDAIAVARAAALARLVAARARLGQSGT